MYIYIYIWIYMYIHIVSSFVCSVQHLGLVGFLLGGLCRLGHLALARRRAQLLFLGLRLRFLVSCFKVEVSGFLFSVFVFFRFQVLGFDATLDAARCY